MRALISVADKTGITELAAELSRLNVEIISTGGTYRHLKESGIPVTEVSEITGFAECLDGRVKTLHPAIHAGILARRSLSEHQESLRKLNIAPIDFVIVNLYPFKKTILKEGTSFSEAVENIDIGGPTMLRAAAKNYQDVVVLVDPKDYAKVLLEYKQNDCISLNTRLYLMHKVFCHTAAYDTLIASYLSDIRNDHSFPEELTFVFEKVQDMRYGENPHQQASFYREITRNTGTLPTAIQLNGKELSFNNINDTNGALELLKEFDEPTVVACKHANPCGVGSADTIEKAWRKAYQADTVSIFGGIVVLNRTLSLEIAKEMLTLFLEVIVAPDYEKDALELLKTKKNLRILKLENISNQANPNSFDFKKIHGGLIVQTIDSKIIPDEIKTVTVDQPTDSQMQDLMFAMKIVKHTKSNAIVLAKNKQSIGIGPGQVNRIWAAKQSIEHAKELIGDNATIGAVLASDAFFPFGDVVEEAMKAGVTAIIQPGGSLRDQESIDKCNQYHIPMVFTGMRHFKH